MCALKRFRPDLKIVTLVEAIYTDLFAADPDIEAIALPRGSGDKRTTFSSRLGVIKGIRDRKFAAVINLHGGPTSAQLTFASGAKYRVASSHFRNGYAYNLRIPSVNEILKQHDISQKLHTVENQFAEFQWLGLPGEQAEETHLRVVPAMEESANTKLIAAGIDMEKPYAVLAPTNEFYTKRWMPERFAEVAEALIERGFQIVMTGAPTDEQRTQLQAVQKATRKTLVSLSSLSIGELVAVIAAANLFVGNDSGPAHIAAAVKTPLVVLFGPASSIRWHPWRAPSVLVQNNFACNPCSMYKCEAFDEPECIRSITITQVMEAIEKVIEGK
ncbi:MAG: glycosyltransferase family 9 protein [Acidobacteria bacterium]|nr:glycosyltransferase family 9 protein [Acidobacteriota bacterium]